MLAVTAGLVAVILALSWVTSWGTSLTPLQVGATTAGPVGLGIVPHTDDSVDTGPPVYSWQRGGRYIAELLITNTASIPITLTGVDGTRPQWLGTFTGPTLGLPTSPNAVMTSYTSFHPQTIPAGGERTITLVYHANPAACGHNLPGGWTSTDSVTFRFTALHVFDDTQDVPLDQAFDMGAPTRAACRTAAG
jgi:hypothetical protein